MLPNFIIIGAGKSGTTTLYEWLKKHPEVFMSPVKETNFFALEGLDLSDVGEDPKQLRHYPWSVTDRKSYEELYQGVSTEKAVGEVSPMYLYNEQAPKGIAASIPNAKIVAILRQPVERLHSRYMHLVRESREPADNYDEVFNRSSIWWERDDLVREGLYGQYLERYFQLFDQRQIRVYLYEDLRNNPQALLKDLFDFIGVDSSVAVDTTTTFNPSGRIKNQFMDKLIGQNSILKEAILKTSPAILDLLKSNSLVQKRLLKMRKANLEKEPVSTLLRKQMIDQIYGKEIRSLQHLIGRDLSHWLN